MYFYLSLGMGISEKIINNRKSRGLTQAEIATRLNISTAYYGRLEKQGESLSIEKLREISSILEIKLESLIIDRYDIIQGQEILLNEFSELTVSYWVHDYLKEILKLFNHDLIEDSLFIREPESKQKLISLIVDKVAYRIFSTNLSIDLEGILIDFFKNRDVAIYYYSKKENTIRVDINRNKHNRGFEKKHNEL